MRYWSLVWGALPANAMAIYPFMVFKDPKQKNNKVLINHEKIHFCQQLELLILPFYLFYLLNYLINIIRFRNHADAYFNICFEQEAYANDYKPGYLKRRKPYSWLSFWF
jgi:hypothetical protein